MTLLFSWKLPEARDQTIVHRKVSRLDLFFDLMFVLLLRDLFYVLNNDVSIEIFGKIFLFFAPARLIRHWYNFYVQRFEESTIRHRLMTFLLMWAIGVYSFSIHDAGLEATQTLIVSWAIGHMILWYMFMSASRFQIFEMISRIAFVVWVLHLLYSLFRILWWFGIFWWAIDLIMLISTLLFILFLFLVPFIFNYVPKLHSAHLSERFWLFIIIVLAELIYGLIAGLSEALFFDSTVVLIGIWWFLMGVMIRGLYFDIIWHNSIRPSSIRYVTHRSLLHLPLSLAIIYLGGMFLHLIFQVSSNIIQTELMFLTWWLVLVIFLIIWVLSTFHEFEYTKNRENSRLSKNLPGYIIVTESIIFWWVLRFLQISTPVALLYTLLLFFLINLIWFHILFDPLDPDEDFE